MNIAIRELAWLLTKFELTKYCKAQLEYCIWQRMYRDGHRDGKLW